MLNFVILGGNKLSGPLPGAWAVLGGGLQVIDLASNVFTGSIPATWSNWTQVRELTVTVAKLYVCEVWVDNIAVEA